MTLTEADEIYAEFARHFNAGDVEGLLSLYEPDAVFVRGPGDEVSGHAAIRAALQAFLAVGGTISFRARHAVQNGDLVLLSNDYTLVGRDAQGAPLTLTGRTSEVLRRQPDGRWLYVIDHPAGGQD